VGVTRAAVRNGFERYVNGLASQTSDAFSISRALRSATGPEGKVIDRLLSNSETVDRKIVQPELKAYRDAILHQFDGVLEYAESDDDFAAFADEILARDLYWDSLQADVGPERRGQLRETLLARQRRMGDAVAPLVAADADSLWGAAADVYDWEATVDLIETHFAFTAPLHDSPDVYELTVRIDPGDLLGGLARALPSITADYTDEAVRAMTEAQASVVDRAKSDARSHFE
jgi:hypothetical protein